MRKESAHGCEDARMREAGARGDSVWWSRGGEEEEEGARREDAEESARGERCDEPATTRRWRVRSGDEDAEGVGAWMRGCEDARSRRARRQRVVVAVTERRRRRRRRGGGESDRALVAMDQAAASYGSGDGSGDG